MNATHTITGSYKRLALIEINEKGNGVFAALDSRYGGRLVCPVTPEFVLPYAERSS